MSNLKVYFFLILFSSLNPVYSQDLFTFKNDEKRAISLNFRSVNNLIILSALLNGEYVNFLLDTGVNKTKIFSQAVDSTSLDNAEFISLRSLGSSEPVKAYKTTNNHIDFGPISGEQQEVYFITDARFDLSSKLGVNVQGIIGYDFLKHFIFRLNYGRKTLRLYQHNKFNRKLRRFDQVDFRLIRKKPHFKLPIELSKGEEEELIFLIDTGSNDAFWIFEKDGFMAPSDSFDDFVGYGLELAVEGKRNKAKSAKIGKYKLKEPRVAFIDSISASLFTADKYKNGILGAETLRRFVWFFDYKNQKAYLKPSKNFNSNSNYDRSGLLLMYTGEEINTIRKPILVRINEDTNYGNSDSDKRFEIRLEVSQILEVAQIRPQSPASKTDIQIGDRILKIDGKSINSMDLEKINKLLSGDEGKRVKIQLKRNQRILNRELILKSQLDSGF